MVIPGGLELIQNKSYDILCGVLFKDDFKVKSVLMYSFIENIRSLSLYT
mgnify:CR=1 FL=1